MAERGQRWARALSVAYGVGLLLVLLTPISQFLLALTVGAGHGWSEAGMPGRPKVDVVGGVLNVVLFAPFGVFAVAAWGRRWWAAVGLAVAFSTAVELIQLIPALHRDATPYDVVCNGLGALIGAVAASAALARRSLGSRSAT